MPVGGGKGGIYAQVWRIHPATPYDAPYSGSGPTDQTSDGAPFQTLNALILSYIDQALADINPTNTSGAVVPTSPAALTVTAFDGLGTYTFSATATYDVEGQYNSGTFKRPTAPRSAIASTRSATPRTATSSPSTTRAAERSTSALPMVPR